MTSGRQTARLSAPSDLHIEQPFAPILLLEFAVAVAVEVLRTRYVAPSGDLHVGEIDEVITAHILARECDQLLETLGDYRRCLLARLARELTE